MIGVRRMLVPFVLAALGCKNPGSPAPAPTALTSLPRDLSATEQKLITSSNTFAFDLLKQINTAQRDSNVFVSPLSASMALGMTANGAVGTTYDAFRTTLRWQDATKQDVNDGYRSLIGLLTTLDPGTDIRIANSIWFEKTFPFKDTFLSDSKSYFSAQVRSLDFAKPSSVDTINAWVGNATAKKIPKIIDAIDDQEVMFLINAIYFKGSWQQQFDKASTRDEPFHALDGTSSNAPLMHMTKTVRAGQLPGLTAVDLGYGNSAFSMTLILPDANSNVNKAAESLTAASWKQLTDSFRDREVDLFVPRFKVEWSRLLNDDLSAMGLDVAFHDGADFTGMSPAGKRLIISRVIQKTYVNVDEEGTEAAAATAVGVTLTSMPVVPTIRFDRPFIFAIRERFSGTIMFIGKIVQIPH